MNAWIDRAFSHLTAITLGLTSWAMFLIHQEVLDGMGACVMDIFVAPLCFGMIYALLFGTLSLITLLLSFFEGSSLPRAAPGKRRP